MSKFCTVEFFNGVDDAEELFKMIVKAVEVRAVDNSFSHAFGTQHQEDIELEYDTARVLVNDAEYLPISYKSEYDGAELEYTLEQVKSIDGVKNAVYSVELI